MKGTISSAEKFLKKIQSDPAGFFVQIAPEGNLLYEGRKRVVLSDFVVIHNGKLWGRAGMTWIPSNPLPEKPVALCAFSLQRLAVFFDEDGVDCISGKKEIATDTSFLLCAKFPSGIRLLIADPSVGKQHITLTLCRDTDGEAFCRALVRQFVQHRLPDQMDALSVLMKGGGDE